MLATLERTNITGEDDTSPIIASHSPNVLYKVLNPDTGLAIWRRELSPTVTTAARKLCDRGECETYSPLAVQTDKFGTVASLKHLPDCIIEDLRLLIIMYCSVTKAEQVSIRLETVTDNGCRRFHIDNVAYRMVTTYCGLGTQWVLPGGENAASTQQEVYTGELGFMREGDVALFRGKKSEGYRVLHRSPQLPAGAKRLVCVIDAIAQAQNILCDFSA
ncbi:MAG: DUF1826 domain-containing protein [Aquisalinus sp.]|nr:DUF1826 domain-containing protein [Aquisalinus sp.]